MGAWSVDVFGSDDALDFILNIEDAIGIQYLYPFPEGNEVAPVRAALEKHMAALTELANQNSNWRNAPKDNLPVLAAVCMVTGAAMSEQLRIMAAEAARLNAQEAEEDGWSDPEERARYMNALAAQIEAHQPGEIASVNHRGLFETISQGFSNAS